MAVPLVNLSAGWTSHEGNGSILLSEGFTPSGSMMRAMLASAPRDVGAPGPDERTGWGVPDLNQVLGLETALGPGTDPVDPSPHLWIHDAFQIDGDWRATMGNRMAHPSTPLATLLEAPWDGNGARGPFLGTGDRATFVLDRVPNEDLHLHMAFLLDLNLGLWRISSSSFGCRMVVLQLARTGHRTGLRSSGPRRRI